MINVGEHSNRQVRFASVFVRFASENMSDSAAIRVNSPSSSIRIVLIGVFKEAKLPLIYSDMLTDM